MPDEAFEGMADLAAKLQVLGAEMGGKVLRQSAMAATQPAFRAIQMAAPVGKKPHKLYTGALAAPGYLKRSVIRRARMEKGKATVVIGVKAAAFYGVQFLDQGAHVTKRKNKAIKPYTITRHQWFKRNFISKRKDMEKRLGDRLRIRIFEVSRK